MKRLLFFLAASLFFFQASTAFASFADRKCTLTMKWAGRSVTETVRVGPWPSALGFCKSIARGPKKAFGRFLVRKGLAKKFSALRRLVYKNSKYCGKRVSVHIRYKVEFNKRTRSTQNVLKYENIYRCRYIPMCPKGWKPIKQNNVYWCIRPGKRILAKVKAKVY